MIRSFKLLLLSASLSQAQLVPRDEPTPLWMTNVPPGDYGNECKMYGNDELLICTGADGSTVAVKPKGGQRAWTHTPSAMSAAQNTRSTSGVAFAFNPTIGNFIIHAVTEGFGFSDPSFCVVYALNPENGNVIWTSQVLEGGCSGTPVISLDANYVFLTHNLMTSGRFTILAANLGGLPFYQELNPKQPYAPPGIFHNPQEGYYNGGQGNRNDIIIWAYRPTPTEQNVGKGGSFAFQFPIGFQDEAINLDVTPLNNVTWQTITAPTIFNQGYSMMFGVSKSQFRSWNGGFGDQANRFDKGASNNADYERGDPKWQAVFATLELSSDPMEPMAFGGAASNVFVGFNSVLDQMWRVNTTFPIYAEARISPDDETVYCVEQNGKVHSIEAVSGVVRWSAALGGAPTTSNFAMSKDGAYLYFNTKGGNLHAWQVADGPTPVPTSSPSSMPSNPTEQPARDPDAPTVFPTTAPTMSNRPSFAPSGSPIIIPTTEFPTLATPQPTLAPTANPATPQPVARAPTSSAPGSYRELTLTMLVVLMSTLVL